MRNRRFKSICFLILFAFFTVSLAGCGGSTVSTTTAARSSTTSSDASNNEGKTISVPTTTKVSTTTEAPTTPVPQVIGTYSFARCGHFHNGFAWVSYRDDEKNDWLAVINEEFKIMYRVPLRSKSYFADPFLEDGCAYYEFTYYDKNYWTESIIVDTTGNELYRTKNTDDTAYKIIGHGANIFLLYKSVNSFSKAGIYFSTIDKNGSTIQPEQEISKGFHSGHFSYHGEGIFSRYDGSGPDYFFNVRTGVLFTEGGNAWGTFITNFKDGLAIFNATSSNRPRVKTVVTPDAFANKEAFDALFDSLSSDDEVFRPRLSYQQPIEVTGYGYGSGGYYPVQLKGADGKAYFTIVDQNGIQQFEPIRYSGLTYYAYTGDTTVQQKLDERFVDGVFVYSEDGEWYVVLPDGTKKSIYGLETSREFLGFDGTYLYLGNSNNSSHPQSVVNVLTGEVHDKIYLYDDLQKQQEGKQNTEATESKSYSSIKNFSIFGTWKNTGSYTYGQAQSGAIIAFDGSRCNFFSPSDTYAFYAEDDHYRLDCTSPLGDTVSFIVRIIDENHIDIFNGQNIVELTRIVQ